MNALADATVAAFLEEVDREAPGFVEGLYLIGSAALGEFLPRTSDLDFLAVSEGTADRGTLSALRRAHARLRRRHPRPCFDGRYVTWAELGRDPERAAPGPHVEAGRFRPHGSGGCDPVAWHTLAAHGVRCRGPERGSFPVFTDAAALARWTRGNFESYWRPLLRRAHRFPDRWAFQALTSYGAVWIVLGVCRLHWTLATGTIAGKEAAGCYGLRAFPERWHRVLLEALRIRRADRARPAPASAAAELLFDLRGGSSYATPWARRRDVLAFADGVLAAADSGYGAT